MSRSQEPTTHDNALERLTRILETRIAPALERIALSLETRGLGTSASEAPPSLATQVRLALAGERWTEAQTLLDAADPAELGGPEQVERMRNELMTGKQRDAVRLREQLDASRQVNDTETVLTLYDQLRPLLPLPDRGPLEREVLQWLLALIMRRMRTGTVRSDVVVLAENVAERFAHTVEGASLRASLPVLRRSSDLCPRCGRPYTGIDDACPECTEAEPAAESPPEESDLETGADDPPT